ncbi:macrophage migration inhibitory factor-like [Rhea pennata]|uniref:macrophage migration inhibitory factor-like n=1 Tax=Rhea pennata TaxID=8795 RepID=UPI002E26FF14
MPKFIVNINLSKGRVPKSFTGELTQQPSQTVGKPAQYIAIQISPDQVMSSGSSTEPCAMCFLYSIGKIGHQENKVYSKVLCDLMNKQLKIPADRSCTYTEFVSFFEISAGNTGCNTTTFA